MSKKNKLIVSAAVAGLSLTIVTTAHAEDVQCWGVNSCGGKSKAKDKASCAVNKAQMESAKKEFKGKFDKASEHECGGKAMCGAKGGNLNWTKVATKEECKKLGGFLMDKSGKIEKL